MSASAQGLQIPIGMSLEEAQLALRQLEQMAREAGKRVKGGLGEGSAGIEKASGGLMQFAREQRREAATARYFVSEFAAFLPVGSATHTVMMQLTGALVGGLGIGAALGAVSVAVQTLTGLWTEAEARMKAADAAVRESAAAMAEARDRAGELAAALRGGSLAAAEFRYNAAAIKESQEIARLTREIEEKTQALAAERESAFRFLPDEEAAEKEILALTNQRATAEDRLRAASLEYQKAQQDAAKAALEASQALIKAGDDAATKAYEARLRAAQERAAAGAGYGASEDANLLSVDMSVREELRRRDIADEQWEIEHANRLFEIDYQLSERRVALEQQTSDAIRQMSVGAIQAFGRSVAAEFGKVLTSSRAYSRAMRAATGETVAGADLSGAALAKMAQDTLAALAVQAAGESVMELARGYAAMGTPWLAWSAPFHFKAAALFATIGGIAAAGAVTIGQTRGMTASERASVDAASGGGGGAPAPSAREAGGEPSGGGGPTINLFFSGRALVTESEVKRELADLLAEMRESGWGN